ncbi:hypothetical protein MHBO_002828 [Bonamia ostreae]|uniref:Uncharacterized protein n=1 Tax=Bonamia ostreae TaxID=126728 RepID=A0ABV2ANM5_9EUKA
MDFAVTESFYKLGIMIPQSSVNGFMINSAIGVLYGISTGYVCYFVSMILFSKYTEKMVEYGYNTSAPRVLEFIHNQ